MRSPVHRGDRGLQGASEANGAPERGVRCHIDPVATYRYPSIPIGSAGGLEDEDEDEDDWPGLMRFCRFRFRIRQGVETRCVDKV
jgi:hypothetical protein